MIGGPERVKFINDRLVNKPLDDDEVQHWLGVLEEQEGKIARGEPSILDAHWVGHLDQSAALFELTVAQLAGTIRHEYVMTLWDQEHRIYPPFDPTVRRPYVR